MSGIIAAICVLIGGAFGGVVNAWFSDNGFILPKAEPAPNGTTILRPGVVGNVVVGSIAGLVSWGLYSSNAGQPIISSQPFSLDWSGLAGAILVGIGGSRWLSSQVDKTLLKSAAAAAAAKPDDDKLAAKLAVLPPAAALQEAML